MFRTRTATVNLLLVAALLAYPLLLVTSSRAMAEEKVQKSELYKKMEVIDEAMKKLKRTLKKADQNPTSLKLAGDIIDAATACRDMTPSKIGKLPEADRTKALADYKASMTKLIDTMGEMKKAIEAGDNTKAIELHKSLKDQEEDGHDKFMEDDQKDADKSKDKADK
jgi:soluble cytochrome b562